MRDPFRIWYTPVTGIWQTVWLEAAPVGHITSLGIDPDSDRRVLELTAHTSRAGGDGDISVRVTGLRMRDRSEALDYRAKGKSDSPIRIPIANAKLWSPDEPWLYDLEVTLHRNGSVVDRVRSYFALRKISLGSDAQGNARLFLNNRELFHWGLLDQGWWPDGLYTTATDKALIHDIVTAKRLGFNLLRKHVKVEMQRWYYHCDRLGMLVWQDMPNGNLRGDQPNSLKVRSDGQDADRDAESARQFEQELKAMIDTHRNHPCIVAWVPFNEGWGQYDTVRITNWIKNYDPSRLVMPAAGWVDYGTGDIWDNHMYPGPGMSPAERRRAVVLGEFGGLGLPLEGHLWIDQENWGYRTLGSFDELQSRFKELLKHLAPIRSRGMAGAIYTQVSDVEIEVNGMMTYDRDILKFKPDEMRMLSRKLYSPYQPATWLVSDSETLPHAWSYSSKTPAEGWTKLDFDDSDWPSAALPIGDDANPLFRCNSPMGGDRVWLRKKFTVTKLPKGISLKAMLGGRTTVFINGQQVTEFDWDRARHYGDINISEHVGALRSGENVIALEFEKSHESQKRVDIGLYAY